MPSFRSKIILSPLEIPKDFLISIGIVICPFEEILLSSNTIYLHPCNVFFTCKLYYDLHRGNFQRRIKVWITSDPSTSNRVDPFSHLAPLVASHNGAMPDYAKQCSEFIAIDFVIGIMGDGEVHLLVSVCHEIVAQPVYECLQYIVFPACVGLVGVVGPACDKAVEPSHLFLLADCKIPPVEYLFCLFPEVSYRFL